jgi:hypothetical protein|tara:strand:- start:11143 stop:11265 length:123 start_codon:yes stop_codon:yes gene_type:complete
MDEIEFIPEEGLDIQFTPSDNLKEDMSEEEWTAYLAIFQT